MKDYFMCKLFFLIMVVLFGIISKVDADEIHGVYGFSRELFKGKNPVQIVQELKEWGVNAVFINKSDFDMIEVLRGSGIKVYYELSCFVGEKYWQRYPASHPVNRSGRNISKVGWYAGVCPNHPSIRKEKLSELKALLEDHEIDGVWFDFIRYPCHWEVKEPYFEQTCFCRNCMLIFQKALGISDPSPDDILIHYRKQWVAWKCNRISDFMRHVRKIVDEERPGTLVGLFGVPWRNDEFDNAIESVIGQKYEDLANYVDIFSPMLYHRMCGKEVTWIHDYVKYLRDKTAKKIIPIVQTSDKDDMMDANEFRRVLQTALTKPSSGVIMLELRNILEKNRQSILREVDYNGN